MTETNAKENETGPCIGCRLPWNEETMPGSCKNAVLVLADDGGVQVTEILVPEKRHARKIRNEQLIAVEPETEAEQEIPYEQSIASEQLVQIQKSLPVELADQIDQSTPSDHVAPVEMATPKGPFTPAEQPAPAEQEIIIGVRV